MNVDTKGYEPLKVQFVLYPAIRNGVYKVPYELGQPANEI